MKTPGAQAGLDAIREFQFRSRSVRRLVSSLNLGDVEDAAYLMAAAGARRACSSETGAPCARAGGGAGSGFESCGSDMGCSPWRVSNVAWVERTDLGFTRDRYFKKGSSRLKPT